jgi:putative hemolysin
LIKGYLRMGAFVGDGAVIDHQFGTTDVFIIMPVEAIKT